MLDQGKWNGAYYLAGYAVELALKACIIKMLLATDAFPDREFSKNCYTHSAREARRAGRSWTVYGKLPRMRTQNLRPTGRSHETGRKKSGITEWTRAEADALYTAIADGTHGVLPWIKTQW